MPKLEGQTNYPNLEGAIAILCPEHRTFGRRQLSIGNRIEITLDHMEQAVGEITRPGADELISPAVVSALITEIGRHRYNYPQRAATLRQLVAAYVIPRWSDFAVPLSEIALSNLYSTAMFEALPILAEDPTFLSVLSTRIAHDNHFSPDSACRALRLVEVQSLQKVRVLLVSAIKRFRQDPRSDWQHVYVVLFSAAGRSLGWTPWIKLFAIVLGAPKHAEQPFTDRESIDPSKTSTENAEAFAELDRQVLKETEIRALAAGLLDLLEEDETYSSAGLLSRSAETRAAYVAGIADACAHDQNLRLAAIELLLWLPSGRATDFAQFAVTRLVRPADKDFMRDLSGHPQRMVGYGADAVRRAAFGARLERDVSLPSAGGSLMESLAEIGVHFPVNEEQPKTWLGDRIAERLIEKTASAVEMRFGKEYLDHSEEGEEKLLAMMFESLSTGFAALDLSLEAIARAASSPRRASVSMRYRTVDKAEEGAAGIKKAKSFSADLCLIVDPLLDGRSLGRRVTLVQAKRLYRDKSLKTNVRWHHSFQLKVTQMSDLMKQTNSSVFLFQGPMLGGRGVPVIPTHLVSALAFHQGGTGTRLARDTVATASRAFADWFTYDLLALRIGDPLEALVTKADGAPGEFLGLFSRSRESR